MKYTYILSNVQTGGATDSAAAGAGAAKPLNDVELFKLTIAQLMTKYWLLPVYGELMYIGSLEDLKRIIQLKIEHSNVTDVNKQSDIGSPICLAARSNDIDIVKSLIRKGADIDAQNRVGGETALIIAVKQGQMKMVQFLIGNFARLHLKDDQGIDIIMHAAMSRNVQILKYLLEHFAYLQNYRILSFRDTDGNTALHHAVPDSTIPEHAPTYRKWDDNCCPIIRLLINNKIDYKIKNNDGKTVMDMHENAKQCVEETPKFRIIKKLIDLPNGVTNSIKESDIIEFHRLIHEIKGNQLVDYIPEDLKAKIKIVIVKKCKATLTNYAKLWNPGIRILLRDLINDL